MAKEKTHDLGRFVYCIAAAAKLPQKFGRSVAGVDVAADVFDIKTASGSIHYRIKSTCGFKYDNGRTSCVAEYVDKGYRQHLHEDGRLNPSLEINNYLEGLRTRLLSVNSQLSPEIRDKHMFISL